MWRYLHLVLRRVVKMPLFKKVIDVYSPVTGKLKPIDKVSDELFSSKTMGDGFAVEPSDHMIVSPIKGEITSIFPTKHAISIKTKGNLEVLLHIGIDTVELKGTGFHLAVEKGDKVTFKTKIADVDFDYLKLKEKVTDVMVIFTNLESRKMVANSGDVSAGQKIGSVL